MSEIFHSFNFEGVEVRMVGTPEEPEWVAKDVCKALGIKNSRDLISRIPDREKGVGFIDTLGGRQRLSTLKEAGLYRAIFSSTKPKAERLQDLTFNEVLPSIRKKGFYSAQPLTPAIVTGKQ